MEANSSEVNDGGMTFEEVAQADLEFRTEEGSKAIDPLAEGAALKAVFASNQHEETCARVLGERCMRHCSLQGICKCIPTLLGMCNYLVQSSG